MSSANYQFTLAVRRGRFYELAQTEGLDTPSRLLAQGIDVVVDMGSVYMQLSHRGKGASTYYFDNAFPQNQRVFMAAAAGVGLAVTDLISSYSGAGISGALTPAYLLLPFIAATTGPGVVRRKSQVPEFHVSQTYCITGRQYYDMQKELQRAAHPQENGIYQILMNNCSSYAIRFATRHGVDVPQVFWPTPRRLARKIEGLEP